MVSSLFLHSYIVHFLRHLSHLLGAPLANTPVAITTTPSEPCEIAPISAWSLRLAPHALSAISTLLLPPRYRGTYVAPAPLLSPLAGYARRVARRTHSFESGLFTGATTPAPARLSHVHPWCS